MSEISLFQAKINSLFVKISRIEISHSNLTAQTETQGIKFDYFLWDLAIGCKVEIYDYDL